MHSAFEVGLEVDNRDFFSVILCSIPSQYCQFLCRLASMTVPELDRQAAAEDILHSLAPALDVHLISR